MSVCLCLCLGLSLCVCVSMSIFVTVSVSASVCVYFYAFAFVCVSGPLARWLRLRSVSVPPQAAAAVWASLVRQWRTNNLAGCRDSRKCQRLPEGTVGSHWKVRRVDRPSPVTGRAQCFRCNRVGLSFQLPSKRRSIERGWRTSKEAMCVMVA